MFEMEHSTNPDLAFLFFIALNKILFQFTPESNYHWRKNILLQLPQEANKVLEAGVKIFCPFLLISPEITPKY